MVPCPDGWGSAGRDRIATQDGEFIINTELNTLQPMSSIRVFPRYGVAWFAFVHR